MGHVAAWEILTFQTAHRCGTNDPLLLLLAGLALWHLSDGSLLVLHHNILATSLNGLASKLVSRPKPVEILTLLKLRLELLSFLNAQDSSTAGRSGSISARA